VVIENIVAGEPETDEAAAILSAIICDKNLKLESWDDECERLVNRVNFVASLFPDICLPDWKTESRKKIVRVLCEGEKRYSDVKSKQILPVIKSIIGSNNPLIDKLAPPFITLPNGRKMVINYEQGKAPFGRARIQDLYELKNLPVIAEGKVKMILEILAPNQRAVQVTDDITGFWNNHYPELKKTLSRRYPKHEWR
jgi:ATP-dependent helicase HrpB